MEIILQNTTEFYYRIVIVIKFYYFNILMNSDDIVNLGKDYTLKDFERESLERRLEILATSVNLIPRALLLLSLEYGKVYTSGRDLLYSLLGYLRIPLYEFSREKTIIQYYIPVSPRAYWGYVSTDIKGKGAMTGINLVTRIQITPEKVGYRLTTFGEIIKSFVAYILKKCAEYEINPWELFGHTPKRGEERSTVYSIKILKYIYEKGETSSNDIIRDLNFSSIVIQNYLSRFRKLGLIEYVYITSKYGEAKKYRINRDKLEDILRCLEDEECRSDATYIYKAPGNIAKRVISYLMENNNLTTITTKELAKALRASYTSIRNIVRWLFYKEVLSQEIPSGRMSIIKITEKGKRVYEEIIMPILEVAKDPDKITKYREELSDKDKWELLKIYSDYKSLFGEKERMILSVLEKEKNGLTTKEISNKTGLHIGTIRAILIRLRKRGIVKNDEKGKWYVSYPR